MWAWLKCLLGDHETTPDINARYERCVRCQKRFRVV